MEPPFQRDRMPLVIDDRHVAGWARSLEDRRCSRGMKLPEARRVLARDTGVSAGTFESLRRGRLKGVKNWIAERIRSAVIRDLQQEIARCTHELELARQAGLDPRSSDMAALETAVQKANELMGKA